MKVLMSHPKGFSLIEMLVAIAIAAVLAALAVPSFSSFVDSARLSSATNALYGDLNRARSEAIKRNRRVLVCVKNSAGTGCATTTAWSDGWVVCADSDSDSACDASTASDPNPVTVRGAIAGGIVVSTTTATASVRFNPDGSYTGNQPFTLQKGTSGTQKQINISSIGNITMP
jgi:type IV fimbrial biogenesis protein FimT